MPQLQRYGRYILVDRLGVGGMAEVFRAVAIGPEQFQRVVVIKRILPHHTENASFVKMFVDEATLCGRLMHPNIIQVHEFGKQDGAYFLAMEYVEGRNLSHVLTRLVARGEHIPVNVAAEIGRQAALGLGYAHALTAADGRPLGIIHRDVTPSNVMIAYTGVVKLLDFGIARVANEARISTTDAGQVKGKSAYLAPEQLKPGPIDGRVDIFSLGIVLHETLTGRRLFKGTNPLQTMKLIQEMEIVRPSKLNPAVPARLDEIVMRALERKPERRYQTATEMAEALEVFLIEQRTSSQELPRFMRALFADELGKGLSLPQEQIKALMAPPAPAPPPVPAASGDSTAEPLEIEVEEGGGSAPHWDPGSALLAQQKRRRLLVAGAGAAAGVLALAVVLLLRSPAETPAPAAPAPAAAPPVAAEPPPGTVTVSISSEPPGAEVFRAGEAQPLGRTPMQLTLPRGEEAIELRITKEGYVPGSLKVLPDADRPALVTLARAAAAPAAEPREEASSSPRSARPRRSHEGKVRNAIPIDPFAQ